MEVASTTANSRVIIADDNADSRSSLMEVISDAKFLPIEAKGPYKTLDEFISFATSEGDAAICDYRLRSRGSYATFEGTELVRTLYQKHFPAVLWSKFAGGEANRIRSYLRWIPVVLTHEDLNPESFRYAIELSKLELDGQFAPKRKPWRTLVRVEDIGFDVKGKPEMIYVVVPAWSPNEGIGIPIEMVPGKAGPSLQAGVRFFARVNIGAETAEQIYFQDFEF